MTRVMDGAPIASIAHGLPATSLESAALSDPALSAGSSHHAYSAGFSRNSIDLRAPLASALTPASVAAVAT